MLSRVFAPVRVLGARRWMSTSVEVDWEGLRRKITSSSGREELARQRVVFEERRNATTRVADAPEIDWDYYAEALPEYNIDEIRTQFNDFMGLLPPITYDASEDLKVQKAKEDRAAKLQTLSTIRYEELVALEAEAEDFALHEYTGAHEMFLRHPGLHEQISQEILDRQFYRDLDPPEKPVELTEEQSARVEHDLLTKAGLNKADFTSK